MLIAIDRFDGEIPRMGEKLLPATASRAAINTRLYSGELQAWYSPLQVLSAPVTGNPVQSIYRFGRSRAPSDFEYWTVSQDDVDFALPPVADNTDERTYYTDGVRPKVTTYAMAISNPASVPTDYYWLGIPKPADLVSAVVSGAVGVDTETRVYVYTYVNSFGEEGQPSEPVTVTWTTGQTTTLTFPTFSVDAKYHIAGIRVYRSFSSSIDASDYLLVNTTADLATSTVTYADTIDYAALGEALATIGYDLPPDELRGILALPNGVMAGFLRNELCLSEAFQPFAWPERYRLTVDTEIVGIGAIGQDVVIVTKGEPHVATGSDPSNYTATKLPLPQAGTSKRAIIATGGSVVYTSPDGLVEVTAGAPSVLTDRFFTRREWQALIPTTMRLAYHDNRILGFFKGYADDSGNTETAVVGLAIVGLAVVGVGDFQDRAIAGQAIAGRAVAGRVASSYIEGGFVFDPRSETSGWTELDYYADAVYIDLQRDALYLYVNGAIVKFDSSVSRDSYTWRSKKFVLPYPTNLGAAIIDAVSYNDLTFNLYVDGELKATRAVVNREPFRLPSGFKGRDVEIELVGSDTVQRVHVSNTIQELRTA